MSEQDALIERVAQAMWDQKEQRNRAILGGENGSLYECVPFADGEDSDTAWWVENARAAIATVRDALLSDEAVAAGARRMWETVGNSAFAEIHPEGFDGRPGSIRRNYLHIARAALMGALDAAAMRAEDDGLEALLERASAVRHIDVYRQVPSHGGWRAWAYTPEGEVNRGDATFTGAIRAAVEAAIREGNAE